MIAAAYMQDRMSVALLIALALHAAIALGVGFEIATQTPAAKNELLDIVLVNWASEEAPEEADFLAQASQVGGGDNDTPERPSEPVSANTPNLEQGTAEVNLVPSSPERAELRREFLTAEAAAEDIAESTTVDEAEETPLPTGEQLILQAQQMARLNAELTDTEETRARSPRRKFISANTRQYEYASYMQAWVAKVERVGNLNYPAEARDRNLSGNLIMTVGVNADGSIESITVQQPSGHEVLDNAARNIVRIGAPYAPLPDNLTETVDVLHITRTWKFSQGTLSED